MFFCHNRAFDNMPLRLDLDQITAPRDYIGAFFYGYDLHTARQFLNKWLRAVTKEKPGKLRAETLERFYTRFEQLMEAAFIVDQLDNDDKGAIIKEPENGHLNPMEIKLFFAGSRRDRGCTHPARLAWEYFPRSLTYAEFLNPYVVLRKCFTRYNIGEWREILRELYSRGIRRETFIDEILEYDFIGLHRLLTKFLEACHLIEAREEMVNIGEVVAAATLEKPSE